MSRIAACTLIAAFGLGCEPPAQPPTSETESTRQPVWVTPTATMSVARAAHTVTKISGNRVLVVGGLNSSGSIGTSQIFDASSRTWSSPLNFGQGRHNHVAVLLKTGDVLVAGGESTVGGVTGRLSSTMIFSIATSTWSVGPPMSVARSRMTATTDPASGTVYLVGGQIDVGGCRSAPCVASTALVELYSQGSISTGSPLALGRYDHSAVASRGKLFVLGGISKGTGLSTEVITGTVSSLSLGGSGPWSSQPPMPTARANFAAKEAPKNSGTILTIGGILSPGSGPITTCESFANNQWASMLPMQTGRRAPSLVELSGNRLLVIGTTNAAEIYSVNSGIWSGADPIPGAAKVPGPAVEVTDGAIEVGGLTTSGTSDASSHVFLDRQWIPLPPGPLTPHQGGAAAKLLDGRIVYAGGASDRTAQLFDPILQSWTSAAAPPIDTDGNEAITMSNGDVFFSSGLVFSPTTNSWMAVPPRPGMSSGHVSCAAPNSAEVLTCSNQDCAIYSSQTNAWTIIPAALPPTIVGLSKFVLHSTGVAIRISGPDVARFDFSTRTWATIGAATDREGCASIVELPNGKILITGDSSASPPGLSEIFDPATGQTTQTSPHLVPRCREALVRFKSGVLAFGGTTPTTRTEYYSPTTGNWIEDAPTTYVRQAFNTAFGALGFSVGTGSALFLGPPTVGAGSSSELLK
jgi:Galactose oxidase, central domain